MIDLQELEKICLGALELPPMERAGYLDRACPNHELRQEVESLLQSQSFADNLFVPAPEAPEDFGETGPYKIVEKLGEGGMGVVFRAHQTEPVERDVALKIIRPGMASLQLVSRFRRERQALAIMDHPNIARVHDAGVTTRGLPYLVMELVSGSTIANYCDAHALDRKQRAALMIPICHAIQHAHSKGIIHRDIKPSNVLVAMYDGMPVPKVIDFGIAKTIEGTLGGLAAGETKAGVIVGTFEYVSPEQAEPGHTDVDTRTDIYSLGALLYRLITGKAALQGLDLENCTYGEILRRIREQSPPPAGAGELDWVLDKALEKDRERRYQTADALALDLRRYVEGEPVEAAPPSTAYRLKKFAVKFKFAIGAATACLVLLLAALGWMTYALREQTRANAIEQEALAVNSFLQNDLLAQASANNQSGPSTKPDRDLTVRTALDRAATRVDGKFNREPNVEAAIRDTIGQTYSDLGLYPEARKQLERALDLERRVFGTENPKTLKTLERLGVTAQLQGNNPEAEALLKQTLETERRVLGPEHSATLQSMNDLAIVYEAQGKYSEAEALHRQSLEIRRRVLGPENPATLQAMNGLANTYYYQGKFAEDAALQIQTLEIQRRVLGPEHPNTLLSMNALAVAYSRQNKYAEAEPLYSQTLEIQRRVLGPEHPNTLHSMSNLAIIDSWLGKYAEAEALHRQNLEISRRVLGPEHSNTVQSMCGLANVYTWEGKYTEAETLLKQALEIRRRVLGPDHSFTLSTLSDLGDMYQRQGNYAAAQAYASEALAGRRRTLGPQHPDTMNSAAALALVYESQEKFAESEPLAREAAETDRTKRADSWQRFRAESVLGASLAGQKKFAEAEPLLLAGYQGMDERKERMQVPNRYYLDLARQSIAHLYQVWGKGEKAAEWTKK